MLRISCDHWYGTLYQQSHAVLTVTQFTPSRMHSNLPFNTSLPPTATHSYTSSHLPSNTSFLAHSYTSSHLPSDSSFHLPQNFINYNNAIECYAQIIRRTDGEILRDAKVDVVLCMDEFRTTMQARNAVCPGAILPITHPKMSITHPKMSSFSCIKPSNTHLATLIINTQHTFNISFSPYSGVLFYTSNIHLHSLFSRHLNPDREFVSYFW